MVAGNSPRVMAARAPRQGRPDAMANSIRRALVMTSAQTSINARRIDPQLALAKRVCAQPADGQQASGQRAA
jgi:hypothetical protein